MATVTDGWLVLGGANRGRHGHLLLLLCRWQQSLFLDLLLLLEMDDSELPQPRGRTPMEGNRRASTSKTN